LCGWGAAEEEEVGFFVLWQDLTVFVIRYNREKMQSMNERAHPLTRWQI
jgi:hypothetical protein